MTPEQKQQALNNAIDSYNRRIDVRDHYRSTGRDNSFSAWGNDKCISRTSDTIDNMESGNASERQYKYWLKH